MNYVRKAREALLAGYPDPPDERDERLIDLYTLLVLTTGEDTTLADVHQAWGIWTLADRPDHKSLVPFGRLAPDVQAYDEPYRDAIRKAARIISE